MKRNRLKYLYRGTAPHLLTTTFSFVLIGIYTIIGLNLTFISPVVEAFKDFDMTDLCYKVMTEQESYAITIVDMTKLENRGDIAMTLQEIESMQPRVIAVDVIFEGVKQDTLGNDLLMNAAGEYDNMVFACRIKEGLHGDVCCINSFFSDSLQICQGVTNMPRPLYNGVKRILQHTWTCNEEEMPSIVDRIMEKLGTKLPNKETTHINFQPTHFTVLQPTDILANRDMIEGRIVMFGAMTDEHDMHYTPLGKISGVELLAYATQTLIEEKAIWRLPRLLHILMTIGLVIFSEWMIGSYMRWTAHHKSPVVRYFLGSYYVISVWQFVWITILMWFVVICFTQWHLSVDIGWTVSAIAMLNMGRSLRDAIEGFLKEKRQKRIKSL